jgi:hypothetical protein
MSPPRVCGPRQRATQDLSTAINRHKEAAIQIRSIARAALGVRNAKLAQFRVQPLRKRKSRTTPTTTIKTPDAKTRSRLLPPSLDP